MREGKFLKKIKIDVNTLLSILDKVEDCYKFEVENIINKLIEKGK